MGWGGTRKGAGRKHVETSKKIRGFRVTDDEWAYLKSALRKYRIGGATTLTYGGADTGADLLAHLESLYEQECKWLKERERYFTDENYDKHTLEEIDMNIELVHLQVVALSPHLAHFTYDYDTQKDCPRCAYVGDIEIKAWREPGLLDHNKENLKLAKTHRKLIEERNKARELERKFNRW